MILPSYVLRDDQKSRIMMLKANGEPRWRIARIMGLPLDAVRDVIRLHSPRRDPITREWIAHRSHDPSQDLSDEEFARRRSEIQENWTPAERANRRAAGSSILRILTGALPS